MAKLTIPETVIDTDTQIQQLATGAVLKGAEVQTLGDSTQYNVTSSKLPLPVAQYVLSVGGSVKEYPLFIEINSKTDTVPEGMPNRDITDEDGNVTGQKTWEEWKGSNYEFYEADNRIFIGTNANSGTDLPLAELTPVMDDLVTPQDLPAPPAPEV